MFDCRKSRSGFTGSPRLTPEYNWWAITRNHAPASSATAAYSQPVASASASVVTTVSQVYTRICLVTCSSVATVGSIGTPAAL